MLVIVSGPPASGKTHVAQGLARILGMPLIAKDDIKEILFDTLGHATQVQTQAYNVPAVALMHHMARQILSAGQSVIIECNFRPELATVELGELQRETGCKLVQVHVDAPPDLLVDRFRRRWDAGGRHPGHHDDETIERVEGSIRAGAYGVIDLDGPLLQVSTRCFARVDVQEIAERIVQWTLHDKSGESQ